MRTIKTSWIMTTVSAVALILGGIVYSNAVEKELPKKEVTETVKVPEMVTFTYEAPINETYPYDDEHVLNSENWKAQDPECSEADEPNAPCTIQVDKTNTIGGAGNEINTSVVTLNLKSAGTQRYIIDAPTTGDNYTNPINTEKP